MSSLILAAYSIAGTTDDVSVGFASSSTVTRCRLSPKVLSKVSVNGYTEICSEKVSRCHNWENCNQQVQALMEDKVWENTNNGTKCSIKMSKYGKEFYQENICFHVYQCYKPALNHQLILF